MLSDLNHLDLDDQEITYAEASGALSDATPLVFLHGGAVDHRMWNPQLDAFPERRVITPDARGHGGSSDADVPYRLADDVVDLLDALGIEQAVLAGLSMGGGTAVDVALEYPDRVAALVVSGTGTSEPAYDDPWCLSTLQRWRSAEQQGDLEGWIDGFMAFTTGPERTRDELDREVWDLVETMARETLAHHLRLDGNGVPLPPVSPTPVADTWDRLPAIRVPVLALCGAQDGKDHQRMGRRLASSVQQGEFVTTPGAHYPNLEDPAAFTAAMRGFLRRHGL
ncbi:alpha/beta fold hydrolase [Microbacterium lushaniae]|nr:alpha/beta fold hydrolase [Microbacterium lushaniae]KAA9154141.1 alpha/beta fold hydrolase [Microbacterium lushaniae]